MNKTYVGIDYGVKKFSLAALTPNGVGAVPEVFSCFWDKKWDQDDVLAEISLTVFRQETLVEDASRIAIEYPFFHRNAKTAIRMSMVAGAIFSTIQLINTHADISFVPPSAWKRQVVGYAHASKDQTMERIENLYGASIINNDDEADALAMAHWAYMTDVDQE